MGDFYLGLPPTIGSSANTNFASNYHARRGNKNRVTNLVGGVTPYTIPGSRMRHKEEAKCRNRLHCCAIKEYKGVPRLIYKDFKFIEAK